MDSDFMPTRKRPFGLQHAAIAAGLVAVVTTAALLLNNRYELTTPSVTSSAVAGVQSMHAEEALPATSTVIQPVAEDISSDSSLLATRLGDTLDWFIRVPDNHYSIQLFMTRTVDADAVESFLRNMPATLDFNKVYIYETTIEGRPMYSVLYDEYSNRHKANTTLNNLPDALQSSKPYLRRVSALRKDLVANRESTTKLQG